MLDNDDIGTGRLLSRREAVELLGVAGASFFLGHRLAPTEFSPSALRAADLACVVRPELTEGPYFVDHQLNRSDIRAETSTGALAKGLPLTLAFNISSVGNNACMPLADAVIDVWHCDADGVYSGVNDGMSGNNTVGKNALRGFQTTDKSGIARFTSVYPGWYQGRAVHVHFKIRTIGADKKAYEFTSQLFFDDKLSDEIFRSAPYNPARRDTRNADDGIFSEGGKDLLLALNKQGGGYTGTVNIGLDLADAATGRPDGMGGGRGPGRGGPPGGPPGGRGRGRGRG